MTAFLTPWIKVHQSNPSARLRLFCFPYAGGWSLNFHSWSEGLPIAVEVCPIELPGRGSRLFESPFTQLSPLIDSLAQSLFPYLDKPFAFFGHSMGSLVSFELARFLRLKFDVQPVHLFVSSRRAPQLPLPYPPIHTLPDNEFLYHLHQLNGTSKTLWDNIQLKQLLLPSLRADFTLSENYDYTIEPPFDFPISVFGGLQDSAVSRAHLEAWRSQTLCAFSLDMLSGDHFFLNSAKPLLLQKLSQKLHQIIAASPDDALWSSDE
jgi:medium-chain acyl-[acyl-carrier-protein] hydrolase